MADPLVFTQANVRALRYTRTDGQPEFTWDKNQVGLGVRITGSGIRSFVFNELATTDARIFSPKPKTTQVADGKRASSFASWNISRSYARISN